MNVHRNGMNMFIFCLIIIIDYCTNARINRFITAFLASSSLTSSSSSFVGATVEAAVLVATVVFFRDLRRLVEDFSPVGTPIEPPGIFASFIDGFDVVTSLAGRAGVTALTFETIHPK